MKIFQTLTSKEKTLLKPHSFQLAFSWKGEDSIDISALLLSDSHKILGQEYFVYYKSECRVSSDLNRICKHSEYKDKPTWRTNTNPSDPEISIVYMMTDDSHERENSNNNEYLIINLDRVKNEISEIIIVASLYDPSNLYVFHDKQMGLVLREENNEFYELYFSENYEKDNVIELVRIYRQDNEWYIEPIGTGNNKGLIGIVEKYT